MEREKKTRCRRLRLKNGVERLLLDGLDGVDGAQVHLVELRVVRKRLCGPGERELSAAHHVRLVADLQGALGALLVIGPEFLYLRDLFGTRINTIFKFYYQAWILWSIAAAFGVAVLQQTLRGVWAFIFNAALILLVTIGLAYPCYSLPNRTGNFRLERVLPLLNEIRISETESLREESRQELDSLWTLDYFNTVEANDPDEAAALRWLQTAPDGVVAEAIGGSYSGYGRVSVYTGLPTVLGWPFHEYQWRGTFSIQGAREADIKTLYASNDWQTAKDILDRYDIRYVYVGDLERAEPLQEEKFTQSLRVAFQSGNVTIYEVP